MKPCEQYLMAIDELVDGTLGPIRRAEFELHLAACDGCRALAADLQAIASTARTLEPLAPPVRVWTRLAERLQQEGRVRVAGRRLGTLRTPMIALAAALLLAIGGSIVLLVPRGPDGVPGASPARPAAPTTATGNPGAADPVQSLDSELAMTERHFQNAVEATRTDAGVDAQTAAVLQKNMLVINQAIAESRAALKGDPESSEARQSLYDVLKQKIQFLQSTIALMNQMRRGDAAGAARSVDGGKS